MTQGTPVLPPWACWLPSSAPASPASPLLPGCKTITAAGLGIARAEDADHAMDDVIHALGSVHLLSGFLHTALERFILQRGEEETPHLTNRERQCLQWAALGKRDADIADKLRISYKKSYYPPSGTSRGKHRIADP